MSRPILLVLGLYAALTTLDRTLGFEVAHDLGHGAISLMAVVISATFAWLWRVRATPMALGMALSWAGCCGLVGFWWVFARLGRMPVLQGERDALFVCIALTLAGAVLHLQVISRAHFHSRTAFWGVLGAVAAASAALSALAG